MKQRHVENISMLIHFMEGLSDPRFDMSRFSHDCDTPACALGWACSIKAFRDKGLTLDLLRSCRVGEIFAATDALFGDGVLSGIFASSLAGKIKTPQQWVEHARAYLKAHGRDVVPADDGFKPFMEKVLVAVALERERA